MVRKVADAAWRLKAPSHTGVSTTRLVCLWILCFSVVIPLISCCLMYPPCGFPSLLLSFSALPPRPNVRQVRQMMVKDNILKSMLNEEATKQLKVDAPNPSDFLSNSDDPPAAGGGGGSRVPPGAPSPPGGAK